MELMTFVQGKDELNAGKVKDFIDSCLDAKLVLIHSSLKDEYIFSNYVDELIAKLKIPFIGTKVIGTATKEGYSEDVVAFAVLCGDFKAEIHHKKINYDNVDETAENITTKLKDSNLCLIHTATYLDKSVYIDAILRRIQMKYPELQIWGNGSSPPPIVFTTEDKFRDEIVFACLKKTKHEFHMDSGFQFDRVSEKEYTITDSDEYLIYGIDNRKAGEEYCKIMRIRPYFINMLQKLSSNSNVVKLFRNLSQASETLYTGIRNAVVKPFGTEFIRGKPEILNVFEVDEKGEKYILTQSYKAKGTKLKKLKNYPEEQLEVYDSLYDKVSNSGGVIICSCAMRPLWYNFNYKKLEGKIRKFNCPIMISHVFTELGTELPYEENRNLLHSGVIKALVFR